MGELGPAVMGWCASINEGAQNLAAVHDMLKKDNEHIVQAVSKNPKQADALLMDEQQCNPKAHSLVYVFLLAARGNARSKGGADEVFVQLACNFFRACDPAHVAREPARVAQVCRALLLHITSLGSPASLVVVRPLRILLEKMTDASKPPHMTVVHRYFALACKLAQCYKEALPVLEKQIIDLPADRAGLEPYDIVVYAYYGGLIYIGTKQYQAALRYFTMAFTASTQGPTSCLIETYKKYLLVSLIARGSLLPLPKWSTRQQQQCALHAGPYTALKDAFDANDAEKVAAALEEHEAVFAKDANLGLAKQVLPAFKRRSVKKLTLTYLTLSLADVATKTGLESAEAAEAIMLEMIEKGEIFASINQRDGMVSFLDSPEQFNSATSGEKLHSKILQAFGVAKNIKALSEHIMTQQEYIQKAQNLDRRAGVTDSMGGGNAAAAMGAGVDGMLM